MNTKFEVLENEFLDTSLIRTENEPHAGIFETARQINMMIDFINQQLVNREEVVRQSFYALLTGEHQLLLSRTGMAKSLLARQIFCCFENATVFEKQLTKDTMPDNLFGAYDIEQMKKGKIQHNVEGSMVMADFAFLDEIFDANDMLLRSLLSLLNEKRLINGEQQIVSALNSVIGATNYLRATEMLEAVLDRFLYKSYMTEDKNLYTQLAIDHIYQDQYGSVNIPEQKIDLADFIPLKKIIKSQTIEIPEYILFLKNYILRKYIEETRAVDPNQANFTISDRTTVKIQDLLRASALLDFRLEVEEKDLYQMCYLICTVGKKEEKDRLVTIIDTTLRYFSSDKETVGEILHLIRIIRDMKHNRAEKRSPASIEREQTIEKIETTLREKGGFRQRLQSMTSKIIPFSNKSEAGKTIDVIHQYCELLRQTAAKKETLEILNGLEQDIETIQPQALFN